MGCQSTYKINIYIYIYKSWIIWGHCDHWEFEIHILWCSKEANILILFQHEASKYTTPHPWWWCGWFKKTTFLHHHTPKKKHRSHGSWSYDVFPNRRQLFFSFSKFMLLFGKTKYLMSRCWEPPKKPSLRRCLSIQIHTQVFVRTEGLGWRKISVGRYYTHLFEVDSW